MAYGALVLAHANAEIVKVTKSGGQGDGWEGPTDGPTRWEGRADAFVRNYRRREMSDGRTEYVDVRRVNLPDGVPVETTDTLTLIYKGEQLVVPVLNLVTNEAPPGVPGGTVVEVEPS